jgi:hypothetical protein
MSIFIDVSEESDAPILKEEENVGRYHVTWYYTSRDSKSVDNAE